MSTHMQEKIFFIYISPYRPSVKKGGLYLFPILFPQKLYTYTFGMGTKNIIISIIKLQEYIKGCALAFFAESTGASFGKRFTLQCVCRKAAQPVPHFNFFIILYHIFLILSRQPAASRQPPPFCKCQKNVADIINPKIYPEKERQNEKNI